MTTTENRWNGPDTPAVHDHPAADTVSFDPALNDELAVDALLAGNGLDKQDEDLLRPFLMELRSLVPDAPPAPSPDLAALLAQSGGAQSSSANSSGANSSGAQSSVHFAAASEGTAALQAAPGTSPETATVTNLDSYRARHGKTPGGIGPASKMPRRAALAAVAVVASLGAAAGAAAAADGDFLAHAQNNISGFFSTLTNQRPANDPAPAPGSPQTPPTGRSAPAGTESPASNPTPKNPASPASTHPAKGLDVQVPNVPGHERETIPSLPGSAQATLPPSIPSEVPSTVPGSTVVPGPGQLKPDTAPESTSNGH